MATAAPPVVPWSLEDSAQPPALYAVGLGVGAVVQSVAQSMGTEAALSTP